MPTMGARLWSSPPLLHPDHPLPLYGDFLIQKELQEGGNSQLRSQRVGVCWFGFFFPAVLSVLALQPRATCTKAEANSFPCAIKVWSLDVWMSSSAIQTERLRAQCSFGGIIIIIIIIISSFRTSAFNSSIATAAVTCAETTSTPCSTPLKSQQYCGGL